MPPAVRPFWLRLLTPTDVLVRALWATYRYLHPEQFPHTPEPEPPPPLIPGVAPTDPEAFLPEVIGEAALAMEGKSEQKT